MTERLQFQIRSVEGRHGSFTSLFGLSDERVAKIMAFVRSEIGEGTVIVELDAAACRGLAADLLLAAERLEHNTSTNNGTDNTTTDRTA